MVELIVIGVGANEGDPMTAVQDALRTLGELADSYGGGFRRSSLWSSSPVDCPPGSPDFVNAVACFPVTDQLQPETLLQQLLEIERRAGRERGSVRNAPRLLDLDLLLFGSELRDTPSLQLPHPRARRRGFVLAPLLELAPDLVWPGPGPGPGRSIRELHAALPDSELDGLRRLPRNEAGGVSGG